MAPQAGGRARDIAQTGAGAGGTIDNGQHICIGAYRETLRLMAVVGVEEKHAFLRMPLTLVDAAGAGLRLRGGPALPAFVLAVLSRRGWRWRERIALLRQAASWQRAGFSCAPEITVAQLCEGLPGDVFTGFIEPLCVAALNTPAAGASGAVFLRVLRDALKSGPGSADLLLPRLGLGSLLPEPASLWLGTRGATLRLSHRVGVIEAAAGGWAIDGERFDGVVLAASAAEAARLALAHAPGWSAGAAALRYEPIVTVYAQAPGCRLPEPMLALDSGPGQPAQFVFDRGQLGGPAGMLALVVSGAAEWVERGSAATAQAALAQAESALGAFLKEPLRLVRTIVEKRATFACTPRLDRPPMAIAPQWVAAGDYVDGPYPATLEGAVRCGVAAARALLG